MRSGSLWFNAEAGAYMRALLFAVLILAAILVFTNPGPESFERFVEDSVAQILVAQAGDSPAGPLVGQLGGALASRLARRHTERDNYFLFSVYRLDLRAAGIPADEWRFLGIGTTFLELHRPEQLRE